MQRGTVRRTKHSLPPCAGHRLGRDDRQAHGCRRERLSVSTCRTRRTTGCGWVFADIRAESGLNATGTPASCWTPRAPAIRNRRLERAVRFAAGPEIHACRPRRARPGGTFRGRELARICINDISVGDVVLMDNGTIQMNGARQKWQGVPGVECEVLTEGKLSSRRHINLPGRESQLCSASLTAKDTGRMRSSALELGVDFIALSFVREARDLAATTGNV